MVLPQGPSARLPSLATRIRIDTISVCHVYSLRSGRRRQNLPLSATATKGTRCTRLILRIDSFRLSQFRPAMLALHCHRSSLPNTTRRFATSLRNRHQKVGTDNTQPPLIKNRPEIQSSSSRFRICADVRFGWFPDENTFGNHPLAQLGLEPYGAFEVQNSSWVRKLAVLESVESGGRENSLRTKRHFIFTFHDTTCECVADSYSLRVHNGSIQTALAEVVQSIGES